MTKIKVGMNIAGPTFFCKSLMFCNLMKSAEDWTAYFLDTAEQEKDYKFELTPTGYPAWLPVHTMAGTFLSWGIPEEYPTGLYVIRYKGKGKVNVNNTNVTVVKASPGVIWIRKTVADANGIFVGIEETDPADPIMDIDVRFVGNRNGTFQTQFLEAMRYSCLRFMDCGHTNELHNPPLEQFNQLPRPDQRSWAINGGMPIAAMLELCNLQGSDFWYCIPHTMNNAGIKRIASQIAQKLNRGLRAYIEFSNEWWNDKFPCNEYFYSRGQQRFRRLSCDSRFDDLYYGRRAMQVMELCRQVFFEHGCADRFYPVLPVHTGAPGREDYFRQCLPKGKHMADFFKAYAIAPYFGYSIFNGSETSWPIVQTWLDLPLEQGLDRYFEYLLNDQHLPPESSISAILSQITHHKQVAESWGLELTAYEWGPHGRAEGELANDTKITDFIYAAGADERMGTAMDLVLGHWHLIGGGTMCFFNGPVAEPSKWGDWGLQTSYSKRGAKYQVLQKWSNRT